MPPSLYYIMYSIFKKEINSFFNSLIAYLVILVFLTFVGLYVWVLPESSVISFGFSDIDPLFQYGPLAFLLLIPAITMRTFAEEKKDGTIELLLTQPLSDWDIIFGKYLASYTLVLMSLIPTLVYYFSVFQLGSPVGNIDSAAVFSSYVGLSLLGAAFCAIGIFTSVITKNQVVAFIICVIFCYVLLDGLGRLATINLWGQYASLLSGLGMAFHYQSLSRGMIDSRDVLYFMSIIVIMLVAAKKVLGSRNW